MAQTFSLTIPAGTLVSSKDLDGKLVRLSADVYAEGAIAAPECGGGWYYSCGGRQYYCCSLPEVRVTVNRPESDSEDGVYGWRHRDGLVTLIG